MELITPSVGTMFWGGIVFILLLILLAKFAWKPMLSAVKEREQSIEESLLLAEKTKHEMKQLQAQNEKLLKEARAERDNMIKEIIAEARQNAKVEANKIIEDAQKAIVNEKNKAMSELKTHVAALSLEIAEKIVKGELSNDDKQKTLANQLVDDINLN